MFLRQEGRSNDTCEYTIVRMTETMRQQLLVQSPERAIPQTLLTTITDIIARNSWDLVTVIVAYATVSGVRQLLNALDSLSYLPRSRWLLGLDDCLTQPGALRLCQSISQSSVRVASFVDVGARFHPKLVCFSSSEHPGQTTMIVGSANLTKRGMTRNGETAAVISSESIIDSQDIETFVDHVWRMGDDLNDTQMTQYEKDYRRCHAAKRRIQKAKRTSSPSEVFADDHAEIDPSLATTCWIEVGKNTALGRELEFKAEQALFFGLKPSGEQAQMRRFLVSNGSTLCLRLKYQENAMWRLQMNNEVPEVAKGLRPRINGKLGRSPYAAVFQRISQPSEFRLKFVRVSSGEFSSLCRRSRELGTLGKTSSRQYGWY